MAKQKPKRSLSDESTIGSHKVQIIVALIALIGVIIPAFFVYLQNQAQITIPLQATQTAEARSAAMTATSNASAALQHSPLPTSVVSTNSTAVAASTTALTLPTITPSSSATVVSIPTAPPPTAPLMFPPTPIPPQTTQLPPQASSPPDGTGLVQSEISWQWQSINTFGHPDCNSSPFLLPAGVDPINRPDEAINKINQAISDKSLNEWAVINNRTDIASYGLFVTIKSISSDPERVILSNKASVHIQVEPDPPEHINAVKFPCQAAGQLPDEFPPIRLQSNLASSYNSSTATDKFKIYTLETGEIAEFIFPFTCEGQGTYTIKIELPYKHKEQLGNIVIDAPSAIFCPKSYTLWVVNSEYTSFLSSEDYKLDGSNYMKIP